MKIIATTLVAFLLLTGCATNDYEKYTSANVEMQLAKSRAEEARYRALEAIANTGNETAKVAAVMALQAGSNQGYQQGIAQPKSNAEIALGWASILVPAVAQMHSVTNQTKLGMHSNDNATSLAKDTNKTMLGISGLITVPEPTVVMQPAPLIVKPEVVDPKVVNPTIVNPVVITK